MTSFHVKENVQIWLAFFLVIYEQLYIRETPEINGKKKKDNAKRGVSPRLTIWPGYLDLWSITLKITRVLDFLKD